MLIHQLSNDFIKEHKLGSYIDDMLKTLAHGQQIGRC